MQAHIATEEMLKSSGLDFITLRAGSYSEAFPLFLNWYPSSKTILLPHLTPSVDEGKAPWTSRDELGEGMAALLAKGLAAYPSIIPQTDRKIILLTGPVAEPFSALVEAINRGRGTDIRIEFLEPEAWVAAQAKNDEGGRVLRGFGRGWSGCRDSRRGIARLLIRRWRCCLGGGRRGVRRLWRGL
ncbi:hypothetical protein LTR91_001409 [Friedmanniomyces endolithicus]|uniref:NmrA-like domain-containing protein n=1 Tax=Friedmanniomyces endolithicus TaxID=329885 RepID=A0AAN6L1L1_9PEZI|nr:hypothetical protein LTR94_002078 [Friedmanniomyces endolithicus]KAK0915765.1 hypothetical protein LTR02_001053 [Friedmanniomyces endolithicus]KAK1013811.1 hypothetical protein LTR91_001409 [Friedmanniomyces endolithicus]